MALGGWWGVRLWQLRRSVGEYRTYWSVPRGESGDMRERGWTSMVTDFAAGWFHPNDRGHRVWADAFSETIGSVALP